MIAVGGAAGFYAGAIGLRRVVWWQLQ